MLGERRWACGVVKSSDEGRDKGPGRERWEPLPGVGKSGETRSRWGWERLSGGRVRSDGRGGNLYRESETIGGRNLWGMGEETRGQESEGLGREGNRGRETSIAVWG